MENNGLVHYKTLLDKGRTYRIDLDNDGNMETFIIEEDKNRRSSSEFVPVCIGDGMFKLVINLSHEAYWYEIMFIDVNGDGKIELVEANKSPYEGIAVYEYYDSNMEYRFSHFYGN